MTNNVIKKLINTELNRFNGKLYVFDFDETLASDTAMVYIVKPNGTRIPISHHDYKNYVQQPGDQIDISQFDTVNDPIANDPIMNLLKSVQDNAIILTARTEAKPIEEYIKTFGIIVPVFAVGSRDPNVICSTYNAKMKTEWLTNALKTFNITEIEFWDDNKLNLWSAEQLSKSFPVKVTTHYVDFDPKREKR